MNKLLASALVVAALCVTGCAGMGQRPVPGGLYSEYKAPAEDYTTETMAGASVKTGRAMCKSILGWVALGDCSIEAAKKAGGISKVAFVDNEYENILGVWATYTTKVVGQ